MMICTTNTKFKIKRLGSKSNCGVGAMPKNDKQGNYTSIRHYIWLHNKLASLLVYMRFFQPFCTKACSLAIRALRRTLKQR